MARVVGCGADGVTGGARGMRFFDRARLDRAFDARSIAVIGAKQRTGYFWFRQYASFAGQCYSVVVVGGEGVRDLDVSLSLNGAQLATDFGARSRWTYTSAKRFVS